MLFTLFTFIIFVSQLIILIALIVWLLKLDKKIVKANAFLDEAKPKIKDISLLAHGVSIQLIEITQMQVRNLKNFGAKLLLDKLESLISLLLFWSINKKVIKKFRRSKFLKALSKGLSFVSHVV